MLLSPPGNATRHPTAVTAATSCAVDAATTPTQTAWSSGATASTTGAATSPAAGVSARWSATSASEACPALWELLGTLRGPPRGLETPRGSVLVTSKCQALEPVCASTWKPPGTEGGPGHQRELTRLKITWQPEALECPLAAFQAGLRSQGHGIGKTGMDLTFCSQITSRPGGKEAGAACPHSVFCGPSPRDPSPPGSSLLGPPHGTTSLGCKCFSVLFVFFLWDVGATEIFIKHSFSFGVACLNSSLYILYI